MNKILNWLLKKKSSFSVKVNKFQKIKKIEDWLKTVNIRSYKINDDLSVDVLTDVNINNLKLKTIPIQFNKIKGYFKCDNNNLKDLTGCPREVAGDFSCKNNGLTSLEGCPQEIDGDFDCSMNKLTTLNQTKIKSAQNFFCYFNELITLEGCPEIINGDFDCSLNKLINLNNGPKVVRKSYDCRNNQLTTLDGSPVELGKDFKCSGNDLIDICLCPKGSGKFIHLISDNLKKIKLLEVFYVENNLEISLENLHTILLYGKLDQKIQNTQNKSSQKFKI